MAKVAWMSSINFLQENSHDTTAQALLFYKLQTGKVSNPQRYEHRIHAQAEEKVRYL